LLNHPNIASIHGFEESDGVNAPAMPTMNGLDDELVHLNPDAAVK